MEAKPFPAKERATHFGQPAHLFTKVAETTVEYDFAPGDEQDWYFAL